MVDDLVVGGQITAAGREAGLTDDDLAGGQLTPEGRAKLESKKVMDEALEPFNVKKAKKPELIAKAEELGLDSSGTADDLRERIGNA